MPVSSSRSRKHRDGSLLLVGFLLLLHGEMGFAQAGGTTSVAATTSSITTTTTTPAPGSSNLTNIVTTRAVVSQSAKSSINAPDALTTVSIEAGTFAVAFEMWVSQATLVGSMLEESVKSRVLKLDIPQSIARSMKKPMIIKLKLLQRVDGGSRRLLLAPSVGDAVKVFWYSPRQQLWIVMVDSTVEDAGTAARVVVTPSFVNKSFLEDAFDWRFVAMTYTLPAWSTNSSLSTTVQNLPTTTPPAQTIVENAGVDVVAVSAGVAAAVIFLILLGIVLWCMYCSKPLPPTNISPPVSREQAMNSLRTEPLRAVNRENERSLDSLFLLSHAEAALCMRSTATHEKKVL